MNVTHEQLQVTDSHTPLYLLRLSSNTDQTNSYPFISFESFLLKDQTHDQKIKITSEKKRKNIELLSV